MHIHHSPTNHKQSKPNSNKISHSSMYRPTDLASSAVSSKKRLLKMEDNRNLPKIRNSRDQLAQKLRRITQYELSTQRYNPAKQPTNKYAQRYSWVNNSQIDYKQLSDSEISAEYKKLLADLYDINNQLESIMRRNTRNLQHEMVQGGRGRNKTEQPDSSQKYSKIHASLNLRSSICHPQPATKRKQIQEQEIKNNQSTIRMFKKEFKSLNKRKEHIKSAQKQSEGSVTNFALKTQIEEEITKTKQQIAKTIKLNEQIKRKNKYLGDSIHNNDEFMDKMYQLELTFESYLKRSQKLKAKLAKVDQARQDIEQKLGAIAGKSDMAEEYLNKQRLLRSNIKSEQSHMQELKTKQHTKQLINKKKSHIVQERQRYYHADLKKLQQLIDRIGSVDGNIRQTEQKNAETKDQIIRLEKTLKELVKKQKQWQKQKQSLNKNNMLLLKEIELYDDTQQRGNPSETNEDIQLEKQKKTLGLSRNNSFQEGIGEAHEQGKQADQKLSNQQLFGVQSGISSIHEQEGDKIKKQGSIKSFLESPSGTQMRKKESSSADKHESPE